jgi:hypothetical protein
MVQMTPIGWYTCIPRDPIIPLYTSRGGEGG